MKKEPDDSGRAHAFSMPFAEFVALMVLLMSLTALSIDAVLPMLDAIRQDLHVANANDAQYVITAMFLGLTLGQFVYGPLSDSFGRKTMIYLGMALFFIGSLFSLVCTDFSFLLLGRVMQGLGAASSRVVTVAMVRDRYSGREMARIMSIIMGAFIVVPIFAPVIGQLILSFGHWRYIFTLFLVIAVTGVAWMHFRLKETLLEEKRRPFRPEILWQGVKEVLANRITCGYMVCVGLVFGGFMGYLTSAQQVFQDYYDTGALFPFYFSSLAFAAGCASFVNSRIVRRFGMRAIARSAFSGIIFFSTIFAVIHFFMPVLPLPVFMGYALVMFFFMGLLFGNLNAVAMEPMGHIAGIASAVIGAVSSAISLAVGSLIGMSFNMTLMPLFLGFLGTSGTGYILQSWLERER